ncbi:trypsin-like peptidase domain-containing protein [candidate division WOR-3 bacterium]|nr:trypsin-like peptidase domain-containing protein [candidate division WOR-3 bacterium]
MALIPLFFLNCAVVIGADTPDEGKRRWVASGFLYGDYIDKDSKGKKSYGVYLVTNRHVLKGFSQVYLRFNPQKADKPARDYPLRLLDEKGDPKWSAHPDAKIDVAVIPVNVQLLRGHAIQIAYFHSDLHVANIEKLVELGIAEGDFAYVLGFPMGIIGDKRVAAIVRSAIIARIRDSLDKTTQEYLIDAFMFPGNSGGPVVSKPEAMAITGTKSQNASYLIGIVKSYIPYKDVAVSLQTKRPRVIFEENSGLAAVHPIDFVQDTIKESEKSLK